MNEPLIILINESRRAWSFPALPVPGVKLTERGKVRPKIVGQTPHGDPLYSTVELEDVKRFRPQVLRAPKLKDGEIDESEPLPRIEVPEWYFKALREISSLRPVFGRKKDGIAVGRTRREAALESEAEVAAQKAQIEGELRRAQSQLEQLRSEQAEREAAIDQRMKALEANLTAAREEARVAKDAAKDSAKAKATKELEELKAENARLKVDLEAATAPPKK